VLVDSEEISSRVLIEMASDLGVVISMEFAEENFTGKSLKNCLDYIESQLGEHLPPHFEETYREKSFHAFKTELQPMDGVHDLLDRIQVPFCVASSGPLEKIRLNLTTTKLIQYFEPNIFSCYQLGRWKPEPDIFLHSAKTMGFTPDQCVVIEDSLPGIQAARAGGFDVYALGQEKDQKKLIDEGATAFFHMNELDRLLS